MKGLLMKDSKFKQYITETIDLLKKQSFRAKGRSNYLDLKRFDAGLVMSYCCILEFFKNQTHGVCIDPQDLGLADIDPEADLLDLKRNPEIEPIECDWPVDPITEEKIQWYIYDLMPLLKERAIDAKKCVDHPSEGNSDFNRGILAAYYQVISTMQAQALKFGLDQKAFNISFIDPDRDLLPSFLKKK